MTLIEKLNFLEESLKLNDRKFAKRYNIKPAVFLKWKSGEINPSPLDVSKICEEFNLDPKDFLDEKSTLVEPKEGEHSVNVLPKEDKNNVIYEDYYREDNSRYEEKD